jgi:hypothetical protein
LGVKWQLKVKIMFKDFFKLCQKEKKIISLKLIEKTVDVFLSEFESLSKRLLKLDWNFAIKLIMLCLANTLFMRECSFFLFSYLA